MDQFSSSENSNVPVVKIKDDRLRVINKTSV